MRWARSPDLVVELQGMNFDEEEKRGGSFLA